MRVPSAILYLLLTGFIVGCASSNTNNVPSSSYACQSEQVSGLPVAGQGVYGCHFYLHHPKTHQILANTAYYLAIYPAPANGRANPAPIVNLEGVTDAQGRSGYVRAAFPITPDRTQFVERIGSGSYGRSPRLIRPTDGLPIPGMNYEVTWCGKPYAGITDELGNGVMFSTTSDACHVKVYFFAKR